MLNLRLLCGAVSFGFIIGAVRCYSEAQSALGAVQAVLYQTALAGALIGLALGAVALCFDHRTATQQRERARFKRKMQRERDLACIDVARARTRSRNRF